MNDNFLLNENIVYWIVGLIIIIMCLLTYFYNNSNETIYDTNDDIEGYYNFCGKCTNKAFGQCLNCANCGFISKNGYGKCVEGDMYGPYKFDPDYVNAKWIHYDDYWRHVMASDDVAIPTTYVYNYRYPYYRRWTGRRPVKWIDIKKNVYPKKLDKSKWNKIGRENKNNKIKLNADGIVGKTMSRPDYNKFNKTQPDII